MSSLSVDAFLGTWLLEPHSSSFTMGSPLRDSMYRISLHGMGLVRFQMEWTGDDGQSHSSVSDLTLRSGRQSISLGSINAIELVSTDDRILDTIAYQGDNVFMRTRRVLSGNRQTMTVIMSGHTPHGEPWENRSTYRRSQED